MKYFDIHGHINFKDFDTDRDAVITRAREAGVGMIVVGTDLESSRQAIALAEANENIYAIIGEHPTDNAVFDYEKFLELAQNKKVIGIGECGLDYFHSKPEELAQQKENFLEQIRLANEAGKPLMLHIRERKGSKDSSVEGGAYQEAIQIIKKHAKVPVNFHFFAGNIADVQAALEIEATFSFTGLVTFTKDYDEIIRAIPLENIMSETDCPFVAPAPYRGKRCEPGYVVETIKAIARIKGEEQGVVAEQLRENVRRVWGV